MNHFWVSLLIFSKNNEVFSADHKVWILCWGQQHGSGSYAIAKSHWRGKIFLSSEHYILFGPYFCYVWCGINNASAFILPYVSSISLSHDKTLWKFRIIDSSGIKYQPVYFLSLYNTTIRDRDQNLILWSRIVWWLKAIGKWSSIYILKIPKCLINLLKSKDLPHEKITQSSIDIQER